MILAYLNVSCDGPGFNLNLSTDSSKHLRSKYNEAANNSKSVFDTLYNTYFGIRADGYKTAYYKNYVDILKRTEIIKKWELLRCNILEKLIKRGRTSNNAFPGGNNAQVCQFRVDFVMLMLINCYKFI